MSRERRGRGGRAGLHGVAVAWRRRSPGRTRRSRVSNARSQFDSGRRRPRISGRPRPRPAIGTPAPAPPRRPARPPRPRRGTRCADVDDHRPRCVGAMGTGCVSCFSVSMRWARGREYCLGVRIAWSALDDRRSVDGGQQGVRRLGPALLVQSRRADVVDPLTVASLARGRPRWCWRRGRGWVSGELGGAATDVAIAGIERRSQLDSGRRKPRISGRPRPRPAGGASAPGTGAARRRRPREAPRGHPDPDAHGTSACPNVAREPAPHQPGRGLRRRSRKISRAALRPGIPETPPPGCVPDPHR